MTADFTSSQRGHWSTLLLMRRQLMVMLANPKTVALLFVQPVLISGLISLAGNEQTSIPKKLFLGSVAILWLACSNAADVIVRERPIFHRERLAGLPLLSYLLSKYVVMGFIASLQALLLYGGLKFFGNGLTGSALIQAAGFVASAWMMTGIGVFISGLCKDSTQAAVAVPIVIIPQILFAGYVFPLEEWKGHPVTAAVGWFCPSRATQQLMDMSLFWGKKLDVETMTDEGTDSGYRDPPHWKNIRLSVIPLSTWLGFEPRTFELNVAQQNSMYDPDPNARHPLKPVRIAWPKTPELPMGRVYRDYRAADYPVRLMAGWFLLSFVGSLWVLRDGASRT
jgi:hypothetical protein